MRKIWMGIVLGLAVVVMTAGCGEKKADSPKSGEQKETADTKEEAGAKSEPDAEGDSSAENSEGSDKSEQDFLDMAKAFVEDLSAGEFRNDSEDYKYDAAMQEAFDSGQIKAGIEPSLQALGEVQEVKEPWIEVQTEQYVNVQVPCVFANQPCNFMVSFTSEGLIGGIFVKEYKESAKLDLPDNVKETELNMEIADGKTLPGTLTVPGNLQKYPAVVFVHGSGPNDRDETIGFNKPFQDLAWGLAQRGIASYRYDKVTYVYGKDAAADKDFTIYEETVNDAVKAANLLREQEGVSKVYILGHSQGAGLMGAIAQGAQPDGCIMMAGPAGDYVEMLERQYHFLESLNPGTTDEEKAAYERAYAEIDRMKEADTLTEGDTVMGWNLPYLKSLLDYDAVGEAEKIEAPVLVLQGEEDYQVTMDDFRIWQEAFGDREEWEFTSFSRLTHLFMEGKYEEGPASYEKENHVPDEVMDRIAEFIR